MAGVATATALAVVAVGAGLLVREGGSAAPDQPSPSPSGLALTSFDTALLCTVSAAGQRKCETRTEADYISRLRDQLMKAPRATANADCQHERELVQLTLYERSKQGLRLPTVELLPRCDIMRRPADVTWFAVSEDLWELITPM